MVKPPEDEAVQIEGRRRDLGISSSYDRYRFHSTVLPLGDVTAYPDSHLDALDRMVRSLEVSPFPVRFDHLHSNALIGKGMTAYRRWQRALSSLLKSKGLPTLPYRFRPHVSLDYGAPVDRTIPIDPVGWLVEELLLIRSIHGKGQHVVMTRWPLVSRQFSFGF
jgi:2'-5' RNA ligase